MSTPLVLEHGDADGLAPLAVEVFRLDNDGLPCPLPSVTRVLSAGQGMVIKVQRGADIRLREVVMPLSGGA